MTYLILTLLVRGNNVKLLRDSFCSMRLTPRSQAVRQSILVSDFGTRVRKHLLKKCSCTMSHW